MRLIRDMGLSKPPSTSLLQRFWLRLLELMTVLLRPVPLVFMVPVYIPTSLW